MTFSFSSLWHLQTIDNPQRNDAYEHWTDFSWAMT